MIVCGWMGGCVYSLLLFYKYRLNYLLAQCSDVLPFHCTYVCTCMYQNMHIYLTRITRMTLLELFSFTFHNFFFHF